MKKFLAVLLIVLFTTTLAWSWDLIRQTDFDTHFYDIMVIDGHLWVVGAGGAVLHSTDDGATFDFVITPAFDPANEFYPSVNAISAYDANHVAIAGDNGFAAYSEDGGASWTMSDTLLAQAYGSDDLEAVVYLPSGEFWVVGDDSKAYYSAGSMTGWTALNLPFTTEVDLTDLYLNDDGIGYIAADDDSLLSTTDFGTTWNLLNTGTGVDYFGLWSDGTQIIACGADGTIVYSGDSGATFVPIDVGGFDEIFSDVAVSGTTAFVAADNGYVASFEIGTTTATILDAMTTANVNSIYANDEDIYLSVSYGFVMHSGDMGQNWQGLTIPAIEFTDVSMINENVWYLLSNDGYFWKTTDGGQTLEYQILPDQHRWTATLQACHFINEMEGVVLADKRLNDTAFIYRTTDGGATWEQTPMADSDYLEDISFPTDQVGYIAGRSNIYKTEDGGQTWNPVSDVDAQCIFFLDAMTGYAGDRSDGDLYVTTDGGVTWTSFVVGLDDVTGIYFKDSQNGVLVDEDGGVFYTTTGGMTAGDWAPATSQPLTWKTGLVADSDGDWWISGENNSEIGYAPDGVLMYSEDGMNWANTTIPNLSQFNELELLGLATYDNWVLAFGEDQVLYLHNIAFDPVGVEDDAVMAGNKLLQNSPNPFNPTTTITFSLNAPDRVIIEVFNATGQKVKTLLDAAMIAGSHSIQWDGTNDNSAPVGSGIYFYTMTAGNEVQSKKMVMLK